MLAIGCVFAAALLAVLADDDCRGTEYCKIPKIDVSRDCPKFGFDCSNNADMLRFNLTTHNGHSVLTCKDRNALLFVKGTPVDALKCDDRRWHFGSCHDTKSALCAKSCATCSLEVPSFIAETAISATVRGGNKQKTPCAIAFCDGPGQRLLGVSEANQATVEITNQTLRCSGDGWVDQSGSRYDYAVCGYYTCPTPQNFTSFTDTSFGAAIPVTVAHGAATCPEGYKLVFSETSGPHATLNTVVCDANSQWSLFGSEIQGDFLATCVQECTVCNQTSAQFPSLCSSKQLGCGACEKVSLDTIVNLAGTQNSVCQKSIVCEDINYAPVLNVAGTNTTAASTCTGTSIQISASEPVSSASCVEFRCKKDPINVPDINFPACPNRTIATCRRANVHTTRVTCPRGWQLLYTAGTSLTPQQTDYLTCAGNGGTQFWDPKNFQLVTVTGASCRKYIDKCNKCPPLRNMYELSSGVFEFPADSLGDAATVQVDPITGCSAVTCSSSNRQLFYNDSPNLITSAVTCGHDARWRTAEGAIVDSVGCFTYLSCQEPSAIPGTTVGNFNENTGILSCSGGTLSFQAGSEAVQSLNTESVSCGSFGRFIVNSTTFLLSGAYSCIV